MKRLRIREPGLALLAWSLSYATAVAAGSLAALVPEDPGLVVEVRDLGTHLAQLPTSKLIARLAGYPPLAALASKAMADLDPKATRLRADLGVAPGKLAAKVFGREVLFAVWPAAAGRPDQAMLLVRAADRAMLEQVLNHIVDEQKKAGKLEPSQAVHLGDQTATVHAIRVHRNQPPAYLAVYGDLGILAGSAALVEQALRAEAANEPSVKSLATLATYQAARERLDPAAVVRVFLNPRPFDEQMAAAPQPKQGGERFIRQAIANAWQASDYLAGSLTLANSATAAGAARVEFFWSCQGSNLKPPFRQVGESLSGQNRLLDQAPADTLAAAAGRLNIGLIVKTLLAAGDNQGQWYLGPPDRSLGTIAALTLLRGLGPDWAVFLTPSAADGEATGDRAPIGWLAAVQTQPLEAGQNQPSLAESLDPLVRSALSIAATASNAHPGHAPAKVETTDVDGLKLTTISGIHGLVAQPGFCYAQSRGLVVAGTSRQRVLQTVQGSGGSSLADNPRVKAMHHAGIGHPTDAVYLDMAGVRRLLADSPRAAEMLAVARRIDRETAVRDLAELLALLKIADALLIEATIDNSGAACSLRLAIDQP